MEVEDDGPGANGAGEGGHSLAAALREAQFASLQFCFGVAGAVGGCSSETEDRCLVMPDFGKELGVDTGYKDALFVVLDGHDGVGAAEFTRERLPQAIRDTGLLGANPGRALQEAVLQIDQAFLASCGDDSSGSCFLACSLRGRHLTVAWAGDSRAVMYDASREDWLDLTQDHSVSRNDDELERLAEAGVFVKRGRVLGILQPTRSIGDLDLKRRAPKGVIAKCEVRNYVVPGPLPAATPASTPPPPQSPPAPQSPSAEQAAVSFAVVSSDGLYEALSSGEVVDMVRDTLAQHGAPRPEAAQAAADRLVAHAQTRSSDDITVIVVLMV